MACTEEEFLELLSDESTVDIITLTEQAKYGIPDKVPGAVGLCSSFLLISMDLGYWTGAARGVALPAACFEAG
jgi:hypothetical protein